MSRTDVHRPYQVQITDPYNRHRTYRFQAWGTQEPGLELLYNVCGCNLCAGQFARKYLRRQERGAWRQVRRELLKTQATDYDDVDWYTAISSPAW